MESLVSQTGKQAQNKQTGKQADTQRESNDPSKSPDIQKAARIT